MDQPAQQDIASETILTAYSHWAPVYDLVFGAVFDRPRRAAALAARAVGGRILEIGIGTGLSFQHYRGAKLALFGIDLCPEMLAKARQRLRSGEYSFVSQLELMDAHRLRFDDGFFDCAVAQFVVTLCAEPEQVLSECARVVRPGGEIILVSHFQSEGGLAARLETWAAAPLRKFGLRPEFPVARLTQWAERDGRASLLQCRPIGMFGFYRLIRFRRI